MVLLQGGQLFTKSTAVMRVARRIGGGWALLSFALALVPRPVRDMLYAGFVKHRYRWFGKQESCMLPTPELKGRFL